MSWLRLDDGFAEHPKLLELSDRQFRVWLRLLLYCARFRTGGVVTDVVLRHLRVKNELLSVFVSVSLLDENDGVFEVHDWNAYNPTDPSNAERQARYRARQSEDRNGSRNADSNAPDRYATVTSHAGTRAQPVQSSPVTPSSSTSTQDAAAVLKELGWKPWQIEQGLREPLRALAWANASHTARNPGGFAWHGYTNGGTPATDQREEKPPMDVVAACQLFIEGNGWDDSYDEQAIRDELGRIERGRRTQGTLDEHTIAGLLEQWAATRQDRYGTPANLPPVPAE